MRGVRLPRTTRALLAALLGLCVLVGVNVLATRIGWRCDLTATKRYSLAPATRAALAQLNATVSAAAFFRPKEPGRALTRDLLDMFARQTPAFTYSFVDPDRSPFRARDLGVTQGGTVVLLCGGKTETVHLPDEETLANALIRVSNARVSTVWFTTGHGELSPIPAAPALPGLPAPQADQGDPALCTRLNSALTAQGVRTDTALLARLAAIPGTVDALVIAGPTRDFLPGELALIDAFAARGGALFVALDAGHATNLEEWMRRALHVERRRGFVLDPMSDAVVGDPMTPLVRDYGTSPAVRDFSLTTLFPTATALAPAREPGGVRLERLGAARPMVTPLARTSEQVWLERDLDGLRKGKAAFDPATDLPGPLWLGVACDPGKRDATDAADTGNDARPVTRAVVFGDQDFMADRYVGLSGNLDLTRNCVQWLMEKEGLVTISKPKGANVFLLLSVWQRRLLMWTPLAVVPGGALCLAAWVAVRRRTGR
ncbi:MAG: GldG family protein [Desulfovibrionaceae bacterium]